MQFIDWIIVGGLLLGSIVVGIVLSRRGTADTASYFKSAGGLPWWLLGVSIIATSFAADTPLVVSGLVITDGISGNWFWWCQVPIVMAGVWFYARLWRRANPMTDMELLAQRYSGPEASFLRGFKSFYLAVPYGCLVMGWVNEAMTKVLGLTFPPLPWVRGLDAVLLSIYLATPLSGSREVAARASLEASPAPIVLLQQATAEARDAGIWNEGGDGLLQVARDMNELKILLLLFCICLLYTTISGLWGVVVSDFLQFWVAMIGCAYLAWAAVGACGGIESMMGMIEANYGAGQATRMTTMLPPMTFVEDAGPGPALRLAVFLLVAWWSVGFTDGGSYMAQRLLAARTERDAALGFLAYAIGHYAVRMWPWIIVGLAAAALFPHVEGADPEQGFVRVMLLVLGKGWLGALLAALLAAYLSTISTRLNLSASYLVNDLYRPFMRKDASERHYVRVAMLMTVLMAAGGIIVSLFLHSIKDAWFLLLALNGGIGAIYLLRWYWWRVSAWTELACLGSLLVLAPLTAFTEPTLGSLARAGLLEASTADALLPWLKYPMSLLLSVPVSVGVAIVVTIFARPTDRARLLDFEKSVRAGGPGWARIDREIRGQDPSWCTDSLLTPRNALAWIVSVVGVYAALFGFGGVLFGDRFAFGLEGDGRALSIFVSIIAVASWWGVAVLFERKKA